MSNSSESASSVLMDSVEIPARLITQEGAKMLARPMILILKGEMLTRVRALKSAVVNHNRGDRKPVQQPRIT